MLEGLDGAQHRTNVVEAEKDHRPPESAEAAAHARDDVEPGVTPYDGPPAVIEGGVRVATARGRVTFRVPRRALGLLRAIRHHRVLVLCEALPASSLVGARPPGPRYAWAVVRVPRRGTVVRTPPMKAVDQCLLVDDGHLVAAGSPTPRGRRHAADWSIGLALAYAIPRLDPAAIAYPSAAAIAATAATEDDNDLAILPAPDAAPASGFGVWSDGGARAVFAVPLGGGRRLFLADDGDGLLRTNIADPAPAAVALGLG